MWILLRFEEGHWAHEFKIMFRKAALLATTTLAGEIPVLAYPLQLVILGWALRTQEATRPFAEFGLAAEIPTPTDSGRFRQRTRSDALEALGIAGQMGNVVLSLVCAITGADRGFWLDLSITLGMMICLGVPATYAAKIVVDEVKQRRVRTPNKVNTPPPQDHPGALLPPDRLLNPIRSHSTT